MKTPKLPQQLAIDLRKGSGETRVSKIPHGSKFKTSVLVPRSDVTIRSVMIKGFFSTCWLTLT